jgi:antibiotic biosynthesis monooxygenase (ABM) superfamily enzyme
MCIRDRLKRRRHPAAPALLVTAGVFAVSLTFRTLDQPLCVAWPLGTHWLWHLLNAVVLARLMRTLAAYGPAAAYSSKW